MSLIPAIRAQLLGSTSLTQKVSQRVYVTKIPQRVNPVLPAIVLKRITGLPVRTHGGPTHRMTQSGRVQVTVWADTQRECTEIHAEAFRALEGQRWTADATEVMSCLKDSEADLAFDARTRIHGIAYDYMVMYSEV